MYIKNHIFFRVLVVFLFLFIVSSVTSQVNDAGLWENIYIEKKLSYKWDVHMNHEGRVNQNMTRFYYAYGDFGVSYKWNKHVHITCDYVLTGKKRLNGFWSTRHQAYVALTLKQKLGSFILSDRIMPQIDYSDVFSSEHGMLPNYHLRNKITLKYNHLSRYTYYIAVELYYKINSYYKPGLPQGNQLDRMRYFAGTFYELNKRSKVELYYLYENNFNINKPTSNFVIGFGYAYSF